MSCFGARLERILFALAGTMTLAAVVLGALVSPWFLALGAFVALNQWLFALSGACPASLLIGRLACRPAEAVRR
jgi:hypothetical protein